MIRYDQDDENAGTQTVNDILPTCSADTLDGERLVQERLSQCDYFRANVRDWGQKMSRFQGIYHDLLPSQDVVAHCSIWLERIDGNGRFSVPWFFRRLDPLGGGRLVQHCLRLTQIALQVADLRLQAFDFLRLVRCLFGGILRHVLCALLIVLQLSDLRLQPLHFGVALRWLSPGA